MGGTVLTLYVTGDTLMSEHAVTNLRELCEENLGGQYELGVVDTVERPQVARCENILATPTLVRESPLPRRRVVGDLSDKRGVLAGLDLPVPECEPVG